MGMRITGSEAQRGCSRHAVGVYGGPLQRHRCNAHGDVSQVRRELTLSLSLDAFAKALAARY